MINKEGCGFFESILHEIGWFKENKVFIPLNLDSDEWDLLQRARDLQPEDSTEKIIGDALAILIDCNELKNGDIETGSYICDGCEERYLLIEGYYEKKGHLYCQCCHDKFEFCHGCGIVIDSPAERDIHSCSWCNECKVK